jgi:hypothetical protein
MSILFDSYKGEFWFYEIVDIFTRVSTADAVNHASSFRSP